MAVDMGKMVVLDRTKPSVVQEFAAFLQEWSKKGVPPETIHESKRVLLHGMAATLLASEFTGIKALKGWVAESGASGRLAHVMWNGFETSAEQAVLVNAAQWFAPLIDETNTKSYGHPAPGSAPVAFALGEVYKASGRRVLEAIVLGMEAGFAMSQMLGLSSYHKRGIFGPSVMPAATAAVIMGLNFEQTWNALGIQLLTGARGAGEQSGHLVSPLVMGSTSSAGVLAAELAARGLDAPYTAFEGSKGIFRGFSEEPLEKAHKIVDNLGKSWGILELTYNTCRGDTTTPALIQTLFEIRNRIPKGKVDLVAKMEFTVDPLTKWLAEERVARWRPDTDLRATSDMPYQVASAWALGYSPLEEKSAELLNDPKILALRDQISWIADDNQHFLGARLAITFRDGSRETSAIKEVHGHYTNPLSDTELENHFHHVAKGRLADARTAEIIDTIWKLDTRPDIEQLMRLLAAPTEKAA